MSTSANTNDLVNYRITVSDPQGSTKEIDKTFPIFSIIVNKTINKIPYARILLYDGDPSEQSFPISNSNLFKIGKTIKIELGYHTDLKIVFQGIIIKHALKANNYATPCLEIYCKDIAYQTTLIPKTISFGDTSDSDALNNIISKYTGIKKASVPLRLNMKF